MFAAKYVGKFSNGFTYCHLRRVCQYRYISSVYSEEHNIETFEAVMKKYENDILFNSIIESNRLRLGYKRNNVALTKQKHYEDKLKAAVQTIQPLPISLKYYCENDYSDKIPQYPTCQPISKCLEGTDITENRGSMQKEHERQFPFNMNMGLVEEVQTSDKACQSIQNEILARKKLINKNIKNWMTNYDNYEDDLINHNEENDKCQISYGTPDSSSSISKYPCGGCGAYLHCKVV